MKKTTKSLFYLFATILILAVFTLSGCGPKPGSSSEEGNNSGMAQVNIRLTQKSSKTASGSEISATYPPITSLRLLVSAEGMENIDNIYSIQGGQTSLDLTVSVPEGADRLFEVFLRNANGANIFYGQSILANLAAGQNPTVNIALIQQKSGPPSPIIETPNNGISFVTNQPNQTYSGSCSPDLVEIWLTYGVYQQPQFDTTFALTSYTAGDTTWSYTHTSQPGYNLFSFYGIDSSGFYSYPPSEIAAYYDSTLLFAPVVTTPNTTSYFATSDSTVTIGGTVDPMADTMYFTYTSAYDTTYDTLAQTNVEVYTAGGTTWSQTHSLTPGSNIFNFYAFNTDGYWALPALYEVNYSPVPYISQLSPAIGSVNIAASSNIVLHVKDDWLPINPASIVMVVEGVTVSPTITGTSSDYTLTYDPPADFSYLQTVNVTVNASNSNNAMAAQSYSFTTIEDVTAPTVNISALVPLPDTIDVEPAHSIYLEIDDSQAGVDQSTLQVTVESVNAIVNGVYANSYTGTIIADGAGGLDVTITLPAGTSAPAQVINVTVAADDTAVNPNTMPLYSYTYTTGEPPVVSGLSPLVDDIDIPASGFIYFEVDDLESDIDPSSLNITVEGADAILGGVLVSGSGFSGSVNSDGSGGYDVTITPDSAFSVGQVVDVTIDVSDSAVLPNAMPQKSYSFTIGTPPTLSNQLPAGGEVDVPPNVQIHLSTNDLETEVDISSINLTINGVNAIVGGAPVTGYLGSVYSNTSNGYDIDIYPVNPFAPDQVVTVVVNASDIATIPNVMTTATYSFTCGEPPVITNLSPLANDPDAPVMASIYFEVDDLKSNIDINSLSMTIEGAAAITNGVTQTGYPGTIAADGSGGYDVTITPSAPFALSQLVNVTIDVQDTATIPNIMPQFVYSFTTGAPPAVTLKTPDNGYQDVPTDVNIYFELDDDVTGVDQTSITVTVENIDTIVGGVAQAGYSGSIIASDGSGGWDVTVNPDAVFAVSQLVNVTIDAHDNSSLTNAMSQLSYSFTTGAPPVVSAQNPAPDAQDVPVASAVYFEIDDAFSAVDNATLSVNINGNAAIVDGVPQAPNYNASITSDGSGGYDVSIDQVADFASYELVTVDIFVSDNAVIPNLMPQVTYSFRCADILAPLAANKNPAAGAVNVAPNSNVYFELDDLDTGVDVSTINVLVNGTSAIFNGAIQSGFAGSLVYDSSGGYDVTINPDTAFPFTQPVNIQIDAIDFATTPNMMTSDVYSFNAGGTASLDITSPYSHNFPSNDTLVAFSGTCSADTYKIETHYISDTIDTTFDIFYTAYSTTWNYNSPLEMNANSFTFTGYDSTLNAGSFDSTYIKRTIVGTTLLKIYEPNKGLDYTTPLSSVDFKGECSPDTYRIELQYASLTDTTADTTFDIPFTPYDTMWTYTDTLLDSTNTYTFTGFDVSDNVGDTDSMKITYDTTHIAPPVITNPNGGVNFSTKWSPQLLEGLCDLTNTFQVFVEYSYPFDSTKDSLTLASYTTNDSTWSQTVSLNEGKNEFAVYVTASDSSVSGRDILIIDFDTTNTGPVITAPNGGVDFSTHKANWTVSGTCPSDTNGITVNGSALGTYTSGSTTWSHDVVLGEGVNVFDFVSVDNVGNTSAPSTLKITLQMHPLKIRGFDSTVELSWQNLTDPDWNEVLILRRQGDYATTIPTDGTAYLQYDSIGNGEVIYKGLDTTYTDNNLPNYEYYYYQLFPYDAAYSYGPPILGVAATRSNSVVICNNTASQQEPRVWGDKVVWTDYRNGSTPDIYMYNLSTKTETAVTSNSVTLQSSPQIWGSRIVYIDDLLDGIVLQLKDLTYDTTVQLPNYFSSVPLAPDIHGETVVYVSDTSAYQEIYQINLSLSPLASTYARDGMNYYNNPAVWGLSMLYEEGFSAQDISVRDISNLTSSQQVAASTGIQEQPDLYDDLLVWQDNRDGYYDIWYRTFDSTAVRLQNDAASQLNPRVYGEQIVWVDYSFDTTNPEIVMYDLSQLQENNITFDTTKNKAAPDIWADKIVWAQEESGSSWDIMLGDTLATGEEEIPDAASDISGWDIWGDKVVYADNRNGNYDIFLYNLATGVETPVCLNAASQINPAIYEDTIVWEDYRGGTADIYGYQPLEGELLISLTTTDAQEHPDIYERHVVWQDRRDGSQYDIYCRDLYDTTETNLTNGVILDQLYPRIHRKRVIWEDHRFAGNSDIYDYDLMTNVSNPLVVDGIDQFKPDVYDTFFVYQQTVSGKQQIYYNNGSSLGLTSDTTADHLDPRIFGNRVVWYRDDGTDQDVYLYDAAESRTILLSGQSFAEETPIINQDKVLFRRTETVSNNSKLFVFDLY